MGTALEPMNIRSVPLTTSLFGRSVIALSKYACGDVKFECITLAAVVHPMYVPFAQFSDLPGFEVPYFHSGTEILADSTSLAVR